MADFDPDAYLATKAKPAAFDPDAFLRARQRGTVPNAEVAGRGLGQGATAGFGEELTAAIQAAPRWAQNLSPIGFLLNPLRALAERTSGVPESQRAAAERVDEEIAAANAGNRMNTYRDVRDSERRANERAKASNPALYTAAEIGGSLPAALAVPAGGLGRAMGTGAVLGGVTGAGKSTADVTQGEVGDAALDTAKGALLGGAAGAAGHGLGKLLGAAATRAGAGVRKAQADAAQKASEKAEAAFRSARSAVGGESTAAHRAIREIEEVAKNEGGVYTAEQVAKAQAWLAQPAVALLRKARADNLLEQAPERLTGSLQTAQNVLAQARGAKAPEAVEQAAEEMLANPIRTQAVPRLKTALSRGIPIAVGSAIGGPVGTVAGSAVAAVAGRPGTALANAMKHPATRNALWRLVQGGAEAGKRGAEVGVPVVERTTNPLRKKKRKTPEEEKED